jgi:glycosyltransferase involved in cell wall biosynthesis
MLSAPRISVITPSFNQAAFIEQTITSVLQQNYPNLEYIIIDGGSTDGSVDIIKKYDSGIAYWVSERDRGQAHAINKGLARATGDIIAYLNSDDYYLDGALARVAEDFNRDPDADLLHGRCRIVDQSGVNLDEQVGSITRYDEILDLWDVWWNRRHFVQPEVFWTKRISDSIGPFREDLFWVMDYDYWLRILAAGGRVGFIDAELAAFRLQPNQKSTQPERTAEELLQVVRPYIFGRHRSLGRFKRIELKGKWLFHARFLKEVDWSLQRQEKRRRRLLRLAWLSIRYPHVLLTRGFRQRLLGSLFPGKTGVTGQSL